MILDRLGGMLTPLALISVGLQLRLGDIKTEGKFVMTGLLFKLVLSPVLILGLMKVLNLNGTFGRVAVMESAMAPMVTATIVAQAHNLRPRLAALMLGLGVPISFLTLLFWKAVV
jgi:predicted permease